MIYDAYETLIYQGSETEYGNVGDACADTCRIINMESYLGKRLPFEQISNILDVTSESGYFIRHPKCMRSWGFGPDQWVPRFLMCVLYLRADEAQAMLDKKRFNDINPFSVQMVNRFNNLENFADILLYGQAIIENHRDKTADVLNWLQCMIYCDLTGGGKWYNRAKETMTLQTLTNKIISYFNKEKSKGFWVPTDVYIAAAEKLYSK